MIELDKKPMNESNPVDYLGRFIGKLYAETAAGHFGLRPFNRLLIVDEPEDMEFICKTPNIFHKDYTALVPLRSRFSANGEEWKIRQSITQPVYVAMSRSANRATVAEIYADCLSRCDCSESQKVHDAILSASVTVFHHAFGLEVPVGKSIELMHRLRDVVGGLQQVAMFSDSPAQRREVERKAQALVSAFEEYSRRNDSLGQLMSEFSKRADGIESFSPAQEFMTNLFAGVETSVAAISWVIDRLGAFPEVQEELSHEALSDHGEAPKIEAFINEVLRRFPPIPFVTREIVAATRLGNRELSPGQHLILSIVGLHHNPRCWQRPHQFDPNRFLEKKHDSSAFLPFLTGPRACAGAVIGRMELSEGVKALLRLFRIERSGSAKAIRFAYALAMRPMTWELIKVVPR